MQNQQVLTFGMNIFLFHNYINYLGSEALVEISPVSTRALIGHKTILHERM